MKPGLRKQLLKLAAVLLVVVFALLTFHFLAHAFNPNEPSHDCYFCRIFSTFLSFYLCAFLLFVNLERQKFVLLENEAPASFHFKTSLAPRAPPVLS